MTYQMWVYQQYDDIQKQNWAVFWLQAQQGQQPGFSPECEELTQRESSIAQGAN